MSLKVWKHGTFGEPEELATDLGAFKTGENLLLTVIVQMIARISFR